MILVVVSTGHFDPLLAECERLRERFDFVGQIGMSSVVPSFPYFRTAPPAEIEARMRESELVVTHAGTGMLSTLYRMRKPAVVIPKQIRYGEANDGQVELGRKWGELGMGVLCMDVADLATAIDRCRASAPRWPQFPSLGAHLLREFGWAAEPARAESRHSSSTSP